MSASTKPTRGRQPGFVPEPTRHIRNYVPTTQIVCLSCRQNFPSFNVKTNRICERCKRTENYGGSR